MMREADARECVAGGSTPESALARSISESDESREFYAGGELCAVWGWKAQGSLGHVWMLSFEPASEHKVALGRESRNMMDELLVRFSRLRAEVHSEHELAIRWLRWLRFIRVGEVQMGSSTFIIMERGRWGH